MYLVYYIDSVSPYLRRYHHLFYELAYVVYRVVGGGVHFEYVERPVLVETYAALALITGFALFGDVGAVYSLGKNTGTGGLAYTSGTAEEIGVSQMSGDDGVFQGCSQRILPYDRTKGRRTVFSCRYYVLFHISFMLDKQSIISYSLDVDKVSKSLYCRLRFVGLWLAALYEMSPIYIDIL